MVYYSNFLLLYYLSTFKIYYFSLTYSIIYKQFIIINYNILKFKKVYSINHIFNKSYLQSILSSTYHYFNN